MSNFHIKNMHNAKIGKGWHWHSRLKCWQALIRVNGKRRYLGKFDSEHDARSAYEAAKREFIPSPAKPKQEAMEI